MKKLTVLFVFILSILLSYFTAIAVNDYNQAQISDVKNDSIFKCNLIIRDYDTVDRYQLINHIMEVAISNDLLISTGWVDDETNTFYYYGTSEYVEYVLLDKVPRTNNNLIKLDDKELSLNSFNEGEYGKIYSVGGFPTHIQNSEFYSFDQVKYSDISLDSRIEVRSLYGSSNVDRAIHELSSYYPELEISYEKREGTTGELDFTWQKSISNYVILSLVFVFLLIMVSMIVIIKKQERFIAISKLLGHSPYQISFRLFSFFSATLIFIFVFGLSIFDFFVIGKIEFYNLLYYQIQLFIMFSFVLLVLSIFVLSTFFIQRLKIVESIKTRTVDQKLLYGGLILKFLLVVVLLSSYFDIYHEFISSIESFIFYQSNKDELSKISYISGSMEDLSISDWKQISTNINDKFIEDNIELYCINYPETYVDNRNHLVDIVSVNKAYVDKYLPSLSNNLSVHDLNDYGVIFIPKLLENEINLYEKFVPPPYLTDEIIIIDKIPDLFFYFPVEKNNDNTLLYVTDVANEYTGPKITYPCFILEEDKGSTSILDSVINSNSISAMLVTKSNEPSVLREITYNTSVLLENGVQAILSFGIIVSFFILMLIIYLYTNLKLIVIKKNLGYSDYQTFSSFIHLNSIIYASGLIYFWYKGNLDWISFSLLVIFVLMEICAIKLYLFINKKNFKKWLS